MARLGRSDLQRVRLLNGTSFSERFFVLSGGPGSGKSTLIEALARAGYAHSIEAGRGIIQQQVAVDGDALPWRNRAKFAASMLEWEVRSYLDAQAQSGPVFFDRGVPDVIGYLRLEGLPVPDDVRRAAETYRYNRRVFIAPPWPEIFAQDAERKQTPDVAVRTYEAMVAVYSALGYELLELPKALVEERVQFVLANIV